LDSQGAAGAVPLPNLAKVTSYGQNGTRTNAGHSMRQGIDQHQTNQQIMA